MTELMQIDSYGALVGPDTLRIQRLLPGPIERVWSYLVDSELRKLWFAEGEFEPVTGETFELVWRNDERAGAKSERPADVSEEHRMQSEVIIADAPHKLVIAWANTGNVTFELEPQGEAVLLTLTHAGFQTRSSLIGHSAGWHAHLDVLEALAFEREPRDFWPRLVALRGEYDERVPADFGA
jgi:uncharacterized protein YndB with AHSA1/START domain